MKVLYFFFSLGVINSAVISITMLCLAYRYVWYGAEVIPPDRIEWGWAILFMSYVYTMVMASIIGGCGGWNKLI